MVGTAFFGVVNGDRPNAKKNPLICLGDYGALLTTLNYLWLNMMIALEIAEMVTPNWRDCRDITPHVSRQAAKAR
jgi:hypothetical protein